MRLWRLSGIKHADSFDGGYGLALDGRWNTAGHAVTYCATSPSLCVLEKLVHIEDPGLLPSMIMVAYDVPDRLSRETCDLAELTIDWQHREAETQQRGGAWHRARSSALLFVPSAIVPLTGSPDVNVVINNDHPEAAEITIADKQPFTLDPRLF